MNNVIDQIKKLSEFTDDYNQAIYRLGVIHGLINKVELPVAQQPKKEVKVIEKSTITVIPEEPKSLEEPKRTAFEQLAIDMTPDKTCTDGRVSKLMERIGDHRNLNFEISKRWANKSYAKTIVGLLSQFKIYTMQDFLAIFDDYDNYEVLNYFNTTNANKDKLLKIFPVRDISESDRKKFCNMYDAMNEDVEGKKTDTDIFTEFINGSPVEKKNCYITRYYNALVRHGIHNIHQLYFWMNHHKVEDLKNIKGVGNVAKTMYELEDYTKKNPINK